MIIGVLGGYGQVGTEFRRAAAAAGHTLVAPTSTEVNLTDADAVSAWVQATRADAWINSAAYTAVDAAEDNAELAFSINRDGAQHLASAIDATGSKTPLIYLSTDYVFAGSKGSPYTESDPTNPQSVYGASKLAGEIASLGYAQATVLRISWVFGSSGHNFVRSILRAARRFDREGGALTVVNDQLGAPCGTPSIARTLLQMLDTTIEPGIYHFGNAPHTNWQAFAKAIVEEAVAMNLLSKSIDVLPQPTSALNQKANRPPDGRLDSTKLQARLSAPAPPWRTDLRTVLNEWARLPTADIDGG